jgi:zinc metalloprotease ZmpB
MMKKITFLLIGLFLIVVKVQGSKKVDANNISDIVNYLNTELEINNLENELQLIYTAHSLMAHHYTFQVMHHQVPVWGWKVKINIANNGSLLSVAKNIGKMQELNSLPKIKDAINIVTIKNDFCKSTLQSIYYKQNESWIEALLHRKSDVGIDSLWITNNNNEVIVIYDCAMYLKKDTIISTNIFLPDPITTSKKYYGIPYINASDSNSTWLSNARIQKNILATYNSDSQKIFLENKFVKMVDFNLPFIAIASQIKDTFNFERNETGFEDCNAFFHITNFHNYISYLGFSQLMNQQIIVDAHGQNGADNSLFSSAGVNPILDFGTGGVNDAEDADVIIHEYSHGISWSANDNLVIDAERVSLDEGIADYFATSYSKAVDTFRWAEMFTWDGHNQFWDGRTASTTAKYSKPFILQKYKGGEVWNAAMMKIWDAIGREATDKIMLQALFSFTDVTTFTEAAAYVLQADSLINNSNNKNVICNAFISKGIEPDWGCTITKPIDAFLVYNQKEFANNVGNLQIQFPISQQIEIVVYNMQGQIVLLKNYNNKDQISISPITFKSGVYLLKLIIDNKQFQSTILHL